MLSLNSHKLTTTSAKHLVDFSHAQNVSLMYKLIPSAIDSDDFSSPLDRDCGKKQRELSTNKNQKVNFHVRNMLKDVFGFAEHQANVHMDWVINQP